MTIALTVLHPAPDVLRTMLVSILMTAAAAIAHADTRTSTPSLIGGQLIAWLSSGSEEVADHASIAAGARAITPEMGFAPSLHHVSAGRPQHYADSAAGRVLYAFPVSDDASLGLHMGDDGYGASALSGAHGFGSGLAYSVNDSLAVTVGIDAIFFDTARSHRFNQYTDCVALEERGELPLLTCSDAIAYTPENLARGEPGATYNVGGGNELTNLELTRAILERLDRPMSLVRSVSDRAGHDRRYSVDWSRLRALGWAPAHGFEDALALTIAWYVDREDWWRPLKSGEYLDYYRRQYGDRLAASSAVE